MDKFNDTRTGENLNALMREIALSCAEYEIFSNIASDEGYSETADFFDKMSKSELALIETYLEEVNGLGLTPENLLTSADILEHRIRHDMNKTARDAELEGFDELAQKILLEKDLHIRQLSRAEELYDSFLNGVYDLDEEVFFGCRNCGHRQKGKYPPEKCPLCSYPRHFFHRYSRR